MRTSSLLGAAIAISLAAAASITFAIGQDAGGAMPMGQAGEMPMGQMGGMPMGQSGDMQMNMMNMMGMMQGAMPSGDEGPSSLAFAGANAKMHRDMAITYTGNADVDFARGMIAHHQGAIDMAKIVIAFGADPEIRTLAEGIVAAQEAEIALMNEWLKKNAQ